jgi:hypothetical protein
MFSASERLSAFGALTGTYTVTATNGTEHAPVVE